MKRLAIAAALLACALPAFAQDLPDPTRPSATDCAAIFSLIAVSERDENGRGSARELSALRLYSNAVRRAVITGEHPDLAAARQAAAGRSVEMLDLMETDAGADAVAVATDACVAGN